MAEPNATAAGAVLALGTVTLTGTILGMHYDALAVGFVAALIALLHMPEKNGAPRSPLRVFSLVAGAAFLAGMLSPVAAVAATNYLPWTAALGRDVLRLAAAAMIGVGVHVAIPLSFSWLTRKSGGDQ
jgi:hypothetical protein